MREKIPKAVPIATLPIRLGQFLKLAEIVQDGVEAKIRIAEGEIRVNGVCEKRRGRQLNEGDIVELAEENSEQFQVTVK